MKYEPVFKLPYSNVFITNLFLPAYGEFNPIITIKNGKWEFFLSEEALKNMAEKGYSLALAEGSYKRFEETYKDFLEKTNKLKEINLKELPKEKFISLLDDFSKFANEFFDTYKETEFFYFSKVEHEINEYVKTTKHSFEEVLSNKVDLAGWQEDKRKLADYIISMQKLKFEYRKLLNDIALGKVSVLSGILEQLVMRTGREDALCMTVEEVKKLLNGENIENASERHVYSYITWDNGLVILKGGEGYKKIRELEQDIPKNEVIGTSANQGIVKGKVKVIPFSINPEEYISKFEEGEVLVSTTTGPEMVVLMEKAAAIVTDEGGMMSHAAIIAREFQIPCVVGTKYATEVFKDGDLVEVNANNGLVRKVDS